MNGNAQIQSTMFGYEDGIMTCLLYLRQGALGQRFGDFCLDNVPKKDEFDRQPSKLCGFCIKRILETVGVGKWEDLSGKFIRVEGDNVRIIKIGHVIEDKWFEPKKEIQMLLESIKNE